MCYGPAKEDVGINLVCTDCDACEEQHIGGYKCVHPMTLKTNGKSRKITTFPYMPEWCPADSDFA